MADRVLGTGILASHPRNGGTGHQETRIHLYRRNSTHRQDMAHAYRQFENCRILRHHLPEDTGGIHHPKRTGLGTVLL